MTVIELIADRRDSVRQILFSKIENRRYFIFLKDVLYLALTTFGGAQTHLAFFYEILVQKRRYISEEELLELNALCQLLPGPAATQLLTAIGYKRGGWLMALAALFVWSFPAFVLMTAFAFFIHYLQQYEISLHFIRFIKPIAVGIVFYAAWHIVHKTVHSKTAWFIVCLSIALCFLFPNPYIFPVVLLLGGLLSAYKMEKQAKMPKTAWHFEWRYALWYVGVFVTVALIANLTDLLPLKLFENFYRNGSLIFGGGQVLIPALYNEFVAFKHYLTPDEFLTGYAFGQAIPGPVFSFSAYIGALAMRQEAWQGIVGAVVATSGIYLPGTFFILFVVQFWEQLKAYRIVRASLEGVTAASAGMVVMGSITLCQTISLDFQSVIIIAATFLLLRFTKVSAAVLIMIGLLAGVLI